LTPGFIYSLISPLSSPARLNSKNSHEHSVFYGCAAFGAWNFLPKLLASKALKIFAAAVPNYAAVVFAIWAKNPAKAAYCPGS